MVVAESQESVSGQWGCSETTQCCTALLFVRAECHTLVQQFLLLIHSEFEVEYEYCCLGVLQGKDKTINIIVTKYSSDEDFPPARSRLDVSSLLAGELAQVKFASVSGVMVNVIAPPLRAKSTTPLFSSTSILLSVPGALM